MKRLILTLFLLASVSGLYAQISQGGYPRTYEQRNLKSAAVIPSLPLKTIHVDELLAEDESLGTPYRYGVVEEVMLDIKSGLETQLDSSTVWRYEIVSDQAKSLKIFFRKLIIPDGATLFIYNNDYSKIAGAFTSSNVTDDSTFAVADFPGGKLIVEYDEPFNAPFSGKVIIGSVSKAYRELEGLLSEDEDSDYMDVNCPSGLDWQLQKHSVCRYTFFEDQYSYLCTGALINNTHNDGTPYFLTANHCVSSSTSAETVTAYFNYETSGCGMREKIFHTLSGATLVTMGNKSDFTLLKFGSVPPANYQPYYAGWDLSDLVTSSVGIHHPEGFRKKISIDNDPAVSYASTISWEDGSVSPVNSHWKVNFDEGKTGGGSSGSPLFNQNKRIVGQLHGGGSYDNLYGKLSYSWDHTSSSGSTSPGGHTTNYASLCESLAAGSRSVTSLDGYSPATNLPEAIFSTNYQYVCLDAPIPFADYSLFGVNRWKWVFTPSTVTFVDGTTSGSQNPVVTFDQAGTYDVKLVVENGVGKDSVTHSSSIISGSKIVVSCDLSVSNGSCLHDFDSVVIAAQGAFTYSWKLNDENVRFGIHTLDTKRFVVSKYADATFDSTTSVTGILVGTQGSCVDTSYYSLKLLLPTNDDIENAQLIQVGTSGTFTNQCAGIEKNEPVPPVETCTSQTDWCDEYGTGNEIVEHSVWFCFYAPPSGCVSIEANDMDGQIALYRASSAQDILNGNYTLLAANDDISDTNPYSKINKVAVTPGKMYWIQFDGSGGGTEGEFTLVVNEESNPDSTTSVDLSEVAGSSITFYPQPASGSITLKSGVFGDSEEVIVRIFDSMGKLVYKGANCFQGKVLSIDLENNWPDGLYVVSVTGNHAVVSGKFIRHKD